MKQVFGNLLLSFLSGFLFVHEGFWMSLKVAQCQNLAKRDYKPSCYGTRSPKNCFTTLLTNKSHPVRKPYKEASRRCNASVPGASLITLNSLESQRDVESFIVSQSLENETIITDARMLSTSESQTWSWVNGQPYSPDVSKDVINSTEQFHDAACVELDHDRQSLTYCFENASLKFRYICEYPGYSYDDNMRYSANTGPDTWYDARKKCLRSRGDLISLMDNRTMKKFPWLRENQKYWIGLHRNKWIWNSTGAALTYTYWENGFPDESPDQQCICFQPQCRTEYERRLSICEAETDRKWATCNCSNSYAVVCQSEEKPFVPRFTTPIRTSSEATLTGATTSTNGVSNDVTGFNTTGIILLVTLFVTVVIIIAAVILFIRKRKYDRRNEGSPVKNTKPDEAALCVYATVAPVNRPSEVTAPAGNAIYAEVEIAQQPTLSSNTIYASVQPTTEAIDMGENVVYADLNISQKD